MFFIINDYLKEHEKSNLRLVNRQWNQIFQPSQKMQLFRNRLLQVIDLLNNLKNYFKNIDERFQIYIFPMSLVESKIEWWRKDRSTSPKYKSFRYIVSLDQLLNLNLFKTFDLFIIDLDSGLILNSKKHAISHIDNISNITDLLRFYDQNVYLTYSIELNIVKDTNYRDAFGSFFEKYDEKFHCFLGNQTSNGCYGFYLK